MVAVAVRHILIGFGMFRFLKVSRTSGSGGSTFPTSSSSVNPTIVTSRTSVVTQKNSFSIEKKKSYQKFPKKSTKAAPVPSTSLPAALNPLEETIATTRPWPARTAQGYICKHCSSLGRGNYCDKHQPVKNVHLMTTEKNCSAGSGLTKFAKDHPSLTLAALCLLQHVADSPIAQ
jgi:hypothetical protein